MAAPTDKDQVLWNHQSGLCTSFTIRVATEAEMANEVPCPLHVIMGRKSRSITSHIPGTHDVGKRCWRTRLF